MFLVGSREELLEFFGCFLVEVSHDIDGGSVNDCVRGDHLEIFGFSVSEEIDRHTGDRQVKTVAVSTSVDQIVFMDIIRERKEILGHIGIAFVECFSHLWIFSKEDEILGDIPGSGNRKGEEEEGKDSDAQAGGSVFGFLGEPENRYGSEEKDRYLGADGTESVRESFVGEEFWCEHGEE